MDDEPLHARHLRSLDFWGGPVTLERLAGGITNHNYVIRSKSGVYVGRVCGPSALLGIDRRNEALCQRAAHALGVAPAVAYEGDGVLVSEYLRAGTLDPASARDPAVVPRLAAALRTLHDGWDRLTGEFLYFSAFQTARTYAATARGLGADLPADVDGLVDDARMLEHTLGPFRPTLCHNDMLPANVLDDGRRVWLIDWEYGGVGHPLFDLAGVSANCGFSADLEEAFLSAYYGSPAVDPAALRSLRVLKAVSLLREALWSAIQAVASDIDFDYAGYAGKSFLAYRTARRALDG